VRLSPKSIFLGLVALGLPFAVTVGWQFAGPTPGPAPISAPVGAGGIGAAPTRATAPTPLKVVDWSSPADETDTGSAAPSAPPSTDTAGEPSVPPPAASTAPRALLPSLTFPPVPTPTDIASPPPRPSATPSSSAAPESPGLPAARLVRRP
jgi:hypothetical protein